MNLLSIDPGDDVAPFEQIRSQLAALVAHGDLVAGQKLPTVRQLAADLGLAVNTVARAYRELEADGVISTQGRRGTFVRSTLLETDPRAASQAQAAADAFAKTARTLGLTLAESTRMLESAWPPNPEAS